MEADSIKPSMACRDISPSSLHAPRNSSAADRDKYTRLRSFQPRDSFNGGYTNGLQIQPLS